MLTRMYRRLVTLCGLALILFSLLPTPAQSAETVVLAWDPNPEPNVSGYRLYYGVQSGIYTNRISIAGATSAVVGGLALGQTYYFAVSAHIEGNESALSAEVVYTIPSSGTGVVPVPPTIKVAMASNMTDLTIEGDPGVFFHLESSTNLLDWTDLGAFQLTSETSTITFPKGSAREFFKVAAPSPSARLSGAGATRDREQPATYSRPATSRTTTSTTGTESP